MAYDYAERLSCDFPATFLRLSPERLCDFPARVYDFDRAADLPTGSAAFPFPGLIVSAWALPVPPGALPVPPGALPVPPGALPVRVFAQFTKNLDFILRLRLTSKHNGVILYLPKGSKCKCTLKSESPYISPCRPVKYVFSVSRSKMGKRNGILYYKGRVLNEIQDNTKGNPGELQ